MKRRASGIQKVIEDHNREDDNLEEEVEYCETRDEYLREDPRFPNLMGDEWKQAASENIKLLRSAKLKLGQSKERLAKKKQEYLAKWNASSAKRSFVAYDEMEKQVLAGMEKMKQEAQRKRRLTVW